MGDLFGPGGLIGGECATCGRRHFPGSIRCPWCGADLSKLVGADCRVAYEKYCPGCGRSLDQEWTIGERKKKGLPFDGLA